MDSITVLLVEDDARLGALTGAHELCEGDTQTPRVRPVRLRGEGVGSWG